MKRIIGTANGPKGGPEYFSRVEEAAKDSFIDEIYICDESVAKEVFNLLKQIWECDWEPNQSLEKQEYLKEYQCKLIDRLAKIEVHIVSARERKKLLKN